MTKKLPTNAITNELAGTSVFFQAPAPTKPSSTPSEKDTKPNPITEIAEVTLSEAPTNQASNRGSTVSRNHDTKQPLHHDVPKENTQFDEIRKAVKQLGKEAATYRFRVEEKAAIADIVYTYTRQGIRTSENEITRIAVNWLLLDYQQNGANSVLARLLEQLHG